MSKTRSSAELRSCLWQKFVCSAHIRMGSWMEMYGDSLERQVEVDYVIYQGGSLQMTDDAHFPKTVTS